MPTGTGRNRAEKGFTLIELLTVLLIIGLALGVSLGVDYSSGPQQLRNQARALVNTTALLHQEALLSGTIHGLDFFTVTQGRSEGYGYRWLSYSDERQRWQLAEVVGWDEYQAETLLDEQFSLQLRVEGIETLIKERVNLINEEDGGLEFSPDIWLLPTQEMTPFSLEIDAGEQMQATIRADMLGRVEMINEN